MTNILKDVEDVAEAGAGMRSRLILGSGLAVALFVVGLVFAHYFEERGRELERAGWLKKEAAERAADLALERKHATDMAALKDHYEAIGRKTSEDHENELAQLRRERDADRAAVDRAGGLRISAAACPASGAVATTEAPGAGGRDEAGAATIRLPQPVEDGLWRLATDADEVSAQLRACQAWIRDNEFYGSISHNDRTLIDKIISAPNNAEEEQP